MLYLPSEYQQTSILCHVHAIIPRCEDPQQIPCVSSHRGMIAGYIFLIRLLILNILNFLNTSFFLLSLLLIAAQLNEPELLCV